MEIVGKINKRERERNISQKIVSRITMYNR